MPVSIVLIAVYYAINSDNKRAKVLIKAIESGNNIDTDKLVEALRKPQLTPAELLNQRLLRGCIFSLVGAALVVCGLLNHVFVSNSAVGLLLLAGIGGGISIAIGVSYLIVYFVTRKKADIDK